MSTESLSADEHAFYGAAARVYAANKDRLDEEAGRALCDLAIYDGYVRARRAGATFAREDVERSKALVARHGDRALRTAAKAYWASVPAVRAEFRNNEESFLAYVTIDVAGRRPSFRR